MGEEDTSTDTGVRRTWSIISFPLCLCHSLGTGSRNIETQDHGAKLNRDQPAKKITKEAQAFFPNLEVVNCSLLLGKTTLQQWSHCLNPAWDHTNTGRL